jgi:serine/threonine protein kinase
MAAIKRNAAMERWVVRVLEIVIDGARAAARPANAYAMPEELVAEDERPANAYAAPDDLAAEASRPAHAYAAPEDLVAEDERPANAYAAPDDLAAEPARPAHAYAAPEDLVAEDERPANAHAAPDDLAAEPAQPANAYAARKDLVAEDGRPADAYAEPADLNFAAEADENAAPPAPPEPGAGPGYVRPPRAPAPPPAARRRQPAPMGPFDPSRASFGDSIKAGGFGSVGWLNTTQPGAPPLVIKVPNTEATRAELEYEAAFYAKAGEHPNVARCYGMQEVEGKRGLVLEGIKGKDMAGTLSKLESLRTADAATLQSLGLDKQLSQESFVGTLQYMMTQTLSGLAHLEEQGVIHNDIRPDNIMCDETTGEVKIVDFGLAKNVGDTTRGNAPIGHGSVAPEFALRGALTGKHDVFGAGEVTRKAMERDQFRYGTDKSHTDLDYNDVRAFARPDADGKTKRALNPKQAPELLDERMAKMDGRVQTLLADPAFQASEAGQALAGAVPQAQSRLEAAQTLAEAEDVVRELDRQVSQAEMQLARQGAPDPTFDDCWGDLYHRIGDLMKEPFIKGTPAVADLAKQQETMLQILRTAHSAPPAETYAALDKAEARLRYDEGRLKKTGEVGATTEYTRFVNWAMNPDPRQRPTAAEALQHPFLADRLLDDATAQEVL